MFAKFNTNRHLYHSVRYNERKVKLGKAELLAAGNFAKGLKDLSWRDKLYHFERLTSLNALVNRNGLHVSVNFHPWDRLSNAEMARIAAEYMEGMGLGKHPYLVYRHEDAAHPHAHIISTVIDNNGKAVNLGPRYLYQSLSLSKKLEQRYRLVESKSQRGKERQVQIIQPGETPVYPAMEQVLKKVVPQYGYTSLEGLNAVLRQYNMEAYRGVEGSRLRAYGGLLYRVLDKDGKPAGAHIKASLFEGKPTLKRLQQRFTVNEAKEERKAQALRVMAAVELALLKKGQDETGLMKALEGQRINLVWTGTLGGEGLYFIDEQTKGVFEGKELGERYDAAALRQRLRSGVNEAETQVLQHRQRHSFKHPL